MMQASLRVKFQNLLFIRILSIIKPFVEILKKKKKKNPISFLKVDIEINHVN